MKTMRSLLLLVLLSLSCHYHVEAQQVSPVKIPFEAALNTEKELVLSQIAAEVKVVSLETTDDCLLSKVKAGAIHMIGMIFISLAIWDYFNSLMMGNLSVQSPEKDKGLANTPVFVM